MEPRTFRAVLLRRLDLRLDMRVMSAGLSGTSGARLGHEHGEWRPSEPRKPLSAPRHRGRSAHPTAFGKHRPSAKPRI